MSKPFNDAFLKACRKEESPHVPVWYMRQAGRYQPEFRRISKKYSFFGMSEIPEICVEVTRLPVEQLGVDAAILFADIVTPLQHIGVQVDIKPDIGPIIENPIRSEKDVECLTKLEPETHVATTLEAISILNQQLSVPLIGFSGAPFTLASYMIEGGPSENYHKTKAFMYAESVAWYSLMEKLGNMTITYLKAQVKAGAHAIQIFDSCVGALNEQDYQIYVAPIMKKIFLALKETGVPTIYFSIGTGHLLNEWNKLPIDVLGLDWRTSIHQVRAKGIIKAIQGNLDPSLLVGPWHLIQERAKSILDQGMKQPGYIFNLGHGVFPDAPVENLQKLTAFIHEYTKR